MALIRALPEPSVAGMAAMRPDGLALLRTSDHGRAVILSRS